MSKEFGLELSCFCWAETQTILAQTSAELAAQRQENYCQSKLDR